MPSLADRKPLLKFSVSAILAKKGEEDSGLVKAESKIKEENDDVSNDAKPFLHGKQQPRAPAVCNDMKGFRNGRLRSCVLVKSHPEFCARII